MPENEGQQATGQQKKALGESKRLPEKDGNAVRKLLSDKPEINNTVSQWRVAGKALGKDDLVVEKEIMDTLLDPKVKMPKQFRDRLPMGGGAEEISSLAAMTTTPFKRDITEYLLRHSGAELKKFLEEFPQYKTHSLEYVENNIPDFAKLKKIWISSQQRNIVDIKIRDSVYYPFIYRGEGSGSVSGTLSGAADITEILDNTVKQGGIKSITETFFSHRPSTSVSFAKKSKTGGLWVVRSDALREFGPGELGVWEPNELYTYAETPAVPLKYVERLLVSEGSREKILAKYGADNTKIFGRPLKDVVIVGFKDSDPNLAERIILDLSLQSSPRKFSPRLEASIKGNYPLYNEPIDISIFEGSPRIIASQKDIPDSPSELMSFTTQLIFDYGVPESSAIDIVEHGLRASRTALDDVFNVIKKSSVTSDKPVVGYDDIFGHYSFLNKMTEDGIEIDIGKAVLDAAKVLKEKGLSEEEIASLFKNGNSFDDFTQLSGLNKEKLRVLMKPIAGGLNIQQRYQKHPN